MVGELLNASISEREHSFSHEDEQILKAMRGGLARKFTEEPRRVA